MRQIFTRRLLPMLLATALCISLLLPAAGAVTQQEIDNLRNQASALNGKKAELKNKLAALADDKAAALERKRLLDDQCDVIQQEINTVAALIANYDDLIAQKEGEIAETEAQEQAQYELFCKRVRAMEENGTVSYWNYIFQANSLANLLSRIDFVNEIMDYDQRVMEDLRVLRDKLSGEKADLEETRSEQVAAKQELDARKAELNAQLAEAKRLVEQIQANEREYQSTLDAMDKEEEAIQQEILRKSRELAAQQRPSGGNANTDIVTSWTAGGGYVWPEKSSKRITSPMGSRYTGIPGASTNHKGVDIGGVGTTTQVLAAKAGTVIIAQKSSSYGNYVVVNHGGTNTTLYAHMSQLLVKAGQSVQQGQVLGITGSTGISNGPHLHFEVTENGVRVDPLKYLTGYIKAW